MKCFKKCRDHGLEKRANSNGEPARSTLTCDAKESRREKELEEKEKETFLFKASPFRDVKQLKNSWSYRVGSFGTVPGLT